MTTESDEATGHPAPVDVARRAVADASVTSMMTDGIIDGIVRQIRRTFPDLAESDIEDAVYAGVEGFYRRALVVDIEEPAAYVYRAAKNQATTIVRRRTLALEDEALEAPDVRAEHDERRRSALMRVLAVVEGWETRRERLVTKAVIEAAAADLQLSSREIADLLRAQGVELSEGAVRVWKSRGIARLRREVRDLGIDVADRDDDESLDPQSEEGVD